MYDGEFDDTLHPPEVAYDDAPLVFTDNNNHVSAGDDDDEGDWRKFVGPGHGEEYHEPEAPEVPLSQNEQLEFSTSGSRAVNHDEGCL